MRIQLLTSKVPSHLKVWMKMLALSAGLLFVLRIVFALLFWEQFSDIAFKDWFIGFYFDAVTLSLLYLPYSAIHFLPIKHRSSRFYKWWTGVYFTLINTTLLAPNLLDMEYFSYTGKRTTADILSFAQNGQDFGQLIGTFFAEFWWVLLLFFVALFFTTTLFFKWAYFEKKEGKWLLKEILLFIVLAPSILILSRGGLQMKPIGIIEATKFTRPKHTAFVLNSTFTFIKSFNNQGLEEKEWFTPAEGKRLFSPIHITKAQNVLPDKTNVVVLILESFGKEWVKSANNELKVSYTPFLDSLSGESLFFPNGYANGKKSIEAVPAILASLPTLMNDAYIVSNYSNNKLQSLPKILAKTKGYSSAFFHGASNGSMRFDAFAALAGFEKYYGRTEYGNDEHYDQSWGILDEYFNPWAAKKMSELKEPFISTLFTLSSHHPYYIPKHRKNQVIKGPSPLCASLSYADLALRLFFEEAKKQPWFKNTVFVLVADHSPASSHPIYSQRHGMYEIPIMFYHPNQKIAARKDPRIFQQLDIMPTLLDLLNIKNRYYGFGQSYFQNAKGEAIAYLEGTYYYFSDDWMIEFNGYQMRSVTDLNTYTVFSADQYEENKTLIDSKLNRLKAFIQRYNHDLILNETTVK
jgi:phosphoglycerol transferase MdoB-like AlkP superfamily enzyme